MTSPPSAFDLAAARARVRRVYDVATFQALGETFLRDLLAYQQASSQGAGDVLPWQTPAANMQQAWSDWHAAACTWNDSPSLQQRFSELVQTTLSRSIHLAHPRYVGHQVPPPPPATILFEALSSLLNQGMAVYEMGPWATAIERVLVAAIYHLIQHGRFPAASEINPTAPAHGLLTHGGSIANLTALLTARNIKLPGVWSKGMHVQTEWPVLLVQQDAHYCIARAAGVLGLGTEQVWRVPLDAQRRMDVTALSRMLQELRNAGRPVLAVVACACSTPVGAFDPLPEIVQLCRKFDVWLHVDAAHGGACAFSARQRHLLAGLADADSFICDAHKMMFVPALCAFVYYRNPQYLYETFQQDAPYLYDPSLNNLAPYDTGLTSLECTKRMMGLPLWGMLQLFGPQLFEDLVDVTFATAQAFYELLAAAEDFEPVQPPQCNIVTFRYVPAELKHATPEQLGKFNLALRRKVIESGSAYLVQTTLDGVGVLRAVIMNPLTEISHLQEIMNCLRAARFDLT